MLATGIEVIPLGEAMPEEDTCLLPLGDCPEPGVVRPALVGHLNLGARWKGELPLAPPSALYQDDFPAPAAFASKAFESRGFAPRMATTAVDEFRRAVNAAPFDAGLLQVGDLVDVTEQISRGMLKNYR